MKLCADAAVQSEGPDGALGRIFALYDVVFNVGYVAAVALAAFAAPPNGWAPWLFAGASGLYLAGPAGAQRPAAPHPPLRCSRVTPLQLNVSGVTLLQRGAAYPTPFSAAHRRSSASASSRD